MSRSYIDKRRLFKTTETIIYDGQGEVISRTKVNEYINAPISGNIHSIVVPLTRAMECGCPCHNGINGIHTRGQNCNCGELAGQTVISNA